MFSYDYFMCIWLLFSFVWIRLGYAAVTSNINDFNVVLMYHMGLHDCNDWTIMLESHTQAIHCFKLKNDTHHFWRHSMARENHVAKPNVKG